MKIFLLKIVPHKKFYVDLNIVSQFKLKKNIISVIFLAFCSLFVLEINLFGDWNFWTFVSILCFEQNSLGYSASSVLKKSNLLTLTKSISDEYRNVSTKIVASTYKNRSGQVEVSGEKIWPLSGYFKNLSTYYNMEKVSYPENSISYINQWYYITSMTIPKTKMMFYRDCFLIRQTIEVSKPPDVCKNREVKYDLIKIWFVHWRICGTLLNCGIHSWNELFFSYRFKKENPKIVYSHYKLRISNSFGGTLCNFHCEITESGELEAKSGNLKSFLYYPLSLTGPRKLTSIWKMWVFHQLI